MTRGPAGSRQQRHSHAAGGQRLVAPLLLLLLVLCPGSPPLGAAQAGSLDRLVDRMMTRLGPSIPQPAKGLNLGLALRRDHSVSSELCDVVRELLVGRLRQRRPRDVVLVDPAGADDVRRARARRAGVQRLLDLELVVIEGYLHLRGTLVPATRSFWRELAQPRPAAVSHLHARVRVDAEIRSYQGRSGSTGLRFSPRRLKLPPGMLPLALAAGDLDGDGRNELGVLTPRALHVMRVEGARLSPLWELALTPPWAEVRSRRPMGALQMVDLDHDGRAELLVGTSEMARAGVFALQEGKLVRKRDLGGYPLGTVVVGKAVRELLASAVKGVDLYDGTALAGPLAEAKGPLGKLSLPTRFYTLRLLRQVRRRRRPARLYLALVDVGGRLQLFRAGTPRAVLSTARVGLALELMDLDDDGALELATTEPGGLEAGRDRVAVYRLQPGTHAPRLLWRSSELAGRLTCLGHGDLDGDGRLELVAALVSSGGTAPVLLILN